MERAYLMYKFWNLHNNVNICVSLDFYAQYIILDKKSNTRLIN